MDKGSTRGVAMYIKKSLKFLKLEASQIIGTNGNAPREVITIEIKLTKNEKLLLSNAYCSPSSDVSENKNINNFLECFGQQKHEHRVIMGDFNRKDINWETDTSTIEENTDFIEAMRDGYLTQRIKLPTRGRGINEPSLIDFFFSSHEEGVESVNIDVPLGKSDLSLIKFVYRSQPMSFPRKLVCCYEKADFKKMRREFDIHWESYFQDCENDIDKTWNKFQTKFAEAEKLYVPKKVVKTNIKRISIPLDRKALSNRKKYRLWKRYLQTKDAKVYVEYCRCRNQVRRLTRQAVKSKEKNIANQVKSNSKQLWR